MVTLYDNGHITLWNENSIDCSVDVSNFEELKELSKILSGMVKDIESRKLGESKELIENE